MGGSTLLDLGRAPGSGGGDASRRRHQPAGTPAGEQVPADHPNHRKDEYPQQDQQTDPRDRGDQLFVQSRQPSTRNVSVVVPIWIMSPGFSATAEIRWPLTIEPFVEPRSVSTTWAPS